jgi:FkbM family methyltransferase
LTEVRVAGGGLTGARLILDLQIEKDYWLGTYEMDLQRCVQDLIQRDMVVYDLGANIGYLSLLLGQLVGSRGMVMAFEPLPANQERLRANLALNPDIPVEMIPKAVSNKSGEMPFIVHASDDMGKLQGSLGRDEDYSRSIRVETITLDDFAYVEGHALPAVIKMDIEGGEALALAGMQHLLDDARPELLIELHGFEAASTVWKILQTADYNMHRLQKGYAVVRDLDTLDWKSYVLGRPSR